MRYTFRGSDQLKASYIWSHARGDLNNLSSTMTPFAAPVFRPNVYGILASDIPSRFVAWGIFALPAKITLSPLVDVHSGFPLFIDRRRAAICGRTERPALPHVFLTRPQDLPHVSGSVPQR